MRALAPSNANYDFEAFNAAGQVWDGAAFVTYAVADYLDYRIAATKLGDANNANIEAWFSAADIPLAVNWVLRLRGASLALSYIMADGPDITETAIANAATAASEVVKIQRAATAVIAGGPTEKHLENSSGATLESVREVVDGNP